MEALLQQALSGLASGGVYASLALALVMINNATGHINFAQGEMAMFSTYIAWLQISAGVSYWLAFATTIALSFVLGTVIEKLLVRRVSTARPVSVIVVFIGLLLIINATAGWLFTYTVRSFPSPFPSGRAFGSHVLSWHELGIIGVTLAAVLSVFLFFRFTKLGLAMRAAAQNPVSSRLVGINVGLTFALGWGFAAALGALAGMMVAPIVFLDPNMMSGVLVYAFAAALLGGISNPWGAVLGGFVIGIAENLVGSYIVGTDLKLTIALIAIVGTLIFKPAGLLSTTTQSRV